MEYSAKDREPRKKPALSKILSDYILTLPLLAPLISFFNITKPKATGTMTTKKGTISAIVPKNMAGVSPEVPEERAVMTVSIFLD